jgi:hypothetical protein
MVQQCNALEVQSTVTEYFYICNEYQPWVWKIPSLNFSAHNCGRFIIVATEHREKCMFNIFNIDHEEDQEG